MSDAKREIPFARPWITDDDRKAVMKVLEGHVLTHGPECKSFEEEFSKFLGTDAYCVSVSSCMAALHLSYIAMGIEKGDEVIVPAQTHTATAHAVELVGATPVFADCDLNTGNMTSNSIEKLITEKTKAISVVHFLGIPCNMPEIMKMADKYNFSVIEDCAIALGARYDNKHVGLFGDTGCFSFYPVKHITTGEGGMFVSQYKDLTEHVSKLRAFGIDRKHDERKIPGMYDVQELGMNYRMSEMQAALGRSQLRRINENLEIRKNNFDNLKSQLSKLEKVLIIDACDEKAKNSHYCLSMVLDCDVQKRNKVVERLNQEGIGTSVYYPQPVPRMKFYREKYFYDESKYKNAKKISDCSIALPIGPHIKNEDINYIYNKVASVLKEVC